MKKEYEVTKTVNGFIIKFTHEPQSYSDENKRVAYTLEEVVEIIGKDVRKKGKKTPHHDL